VRDEDEVHQWVGGRGYAMEGDGDEVCVWERVVVGGAGGGGEECVFRGRGYVGGGQEGGEREIGVRIWVSAPLEQSAALLLRARE